MKILSITDLHTKSFNSSPLLEKDFDVIILAGDFSYFGNRYEKSLEFLDSLNKPVYFINGNHEANYLDTNVIGEKYKNFVYVGMKARDINIAGEEFTILGIDGNNDISPDNREDETAYYLYQEIFSLNPMLEQRILISHFQPKGLFLNDSYGSNTVRKIYDHFHPTLTVCGHSHNHFGKCDKQHNIFNPGDKGMILEIVNL